MSIYAVGTMKTSDYDYDLPEELIAQEPAAERDGCRMLVMDRETGALEDRIFRDIEDYLQPGDLLVANETRVMPARLLGTKRGTGGAAEVFLLREVAGSEPRTNTCAFWEVLVRPGKRLKPGTGAVVDFQDVQGKVALSAEIVDWAAGAQKGERVAKLTTELPSLDEALHAVGNTPLPPYIKNYAGDTELYQTVFSKRETSAAAPTAGLHFTPELIERLKAKGVHWETVELEVGLDTFRVVDEEDPAEHKIHTEFFTVNQRVVDAVAETRKRGGRVIAVGTTSVRSLESAWDAQAANNGTAKAEGYDVADGLDVKGSSIKWPGGRSAGREVPKGESATSANDDTAQADYRVAGEPSSGADSARADAPTNAQNDVAVGTPGENAQRGALTPRDREATSLYILPGYRFNVVDALITNFHVPRSTLMMLVSAFSSRENLLSAYEHAIEERYRLLSFGDAMFIQ